MKKILFILTILILSFSSFAQKESNVWYFGYNTGLSFNDLEGKTAQSGNYIRDLPTRIVGPVQTWEGCFSISNARGEFLFASDGINVYDSSMSLMQNGNQLKGNPSATQSGIVIPYPENDGKYFIISVGSQSTATGIHYSVVDLSLNGGLGAVTAEKNVQLTARDHLNANIPNTSMAENVAAVMDANGTDYWLINSSMFYFNAWHITKNGINATPVVSAPASIPGTNKYGKVGYLKASPDGKKVIRVDARGYIILADFDTSTGKATNIIEATATSQPLYGVEFSANSQYVYIARSAASYGGICVKKVEDITASSSFAFDRSPVHTLQLGTDRRIYGIGGVNLNGASGTRGYPDLIVIENPDTGDNTVEIIKDFFDDGSGVSPVALGLPPFLSSFFNISDIEGNKLACMGDKQTYKISIDISGGMSQVAYIDWNFGDGTPIVRKAVAPSDHECSADHTYTTNGVYEISTKALIADGITPVPDGDTKFEVEIYRCEIASNRMVRSHLGAARQ